MPKETALKNLREIPGVGPSIAKDLHDLGIREVADLKRKNPERMYFDLCRKRGQHIDRCMLYVLRCAVYYAKTKKHNPNKLLWWNWKDKIEKKQSEGKMTEEKPKRGALLYYQLASVILLLVLVGFSISGLWGLVEIVAPRLTTENYEWKMLSSLDRYAQDKYREKNGLYFNRLEKEDSTAALTREQVEAKWKSAQEEVLNDERREGLRMIMLWFVVVIVCLPLYLYHHKAVKKGRQGMEQAAG